MRLLEIQQGIFINTDRIDAVEKVDDFTCKVYMGPHVLESTLSYENLTQLLKVQLQEKDNREQQLLNIAKTQTFYAG